MDKKGQLGFGVLISAFIGIVLGLLLLQASAVYVEQGTRENTGVVTVSNKTYTAPAAGSWIDLVGQELVGTPLVTNATDGTTVPATNYTIAEGISTTTGLKTVRYYATSVPYATKSVNISYTYYPDGYIDDAGGRSIASLIIIFFALGIAALALIPSLRSGVMNMMSR